MTKSPITLACFGPFKKYKPEPQPDRPEWGIYYCDPLGRDWLDTQREFNAETLKVMFDEKGVIVSQTQDVSGFSPNGRWVAEVEADKVPDGFDINGGWQYLSGEIIPREYTQEELSAQAERQKRRLMEHAERTLASLERAERLGIATDDEKKRLFAWATYSVFLNRIDTTNALGIEWPDTP